jgi:nitroreductase
MENKEAGMATQSTLEQILDLARWAPSGDNTQPWRFEICDDHHVVVHGHDTRDHCVYDLDGHPSQISIGALLETMAIAASAHGLRMSSRRRPDTDSSRLTFDIEFEHDPTVERDPLVSFIPLRAVQRRPMSTRRLAAHVKSQAEAAAGADYEIIWLERLGDRLRTALMMFHNARLRLTMPEAYLVHRDVIEWNARYSEDRIPDQALGADPMTTRLMRFVMKSWERVDFFNTYLAGTWAPRIQMDLIPGIACAAHFAIVARQAPSSVDDYVAAGRAVQRVWLTLTKFGLGMQPELTPLIFGSYVRAGIKFSRVGKLQREAEELERAVKDVIGEQYANAVFMARTGATRAPRARSIRLPLKKLIESRH